MLGTSDIAISSKEKTSYYYRFYYYYYYYYWDSGVSLWLNVNINFKIQCATMFFRIGLLRVPIDLELKLGWSDLWENTLISTGSLLRDEDVLCIVL